MLENERQKKILDYILEHGSITVKKIISEFYVSEATARRDLKKLEETDSIKKVFGGATALDRKYHVTPYILRETEYLQEKKDLCERAAEFIRDGYTIYLDGSSTVHCLLPHLLKFKDIQVLTNSMYVLQFLFEHNIKAFCTGGRLATHSPLLVGYETLDFLDNFNIDISFMSISGINKDGVVSGLYQDACEIMKKVLQKSVTNVLILSHEKIGQNFPHVICRSSDLDYLIIDRSIEADFPLKNGKRLIQRCNSVF